MAKTGTEILRGEHEAVLRMLDLTEGVARELLGGKRVKGEVLEDLLEFFQLFADRCHHGKEEEALFPLLRAKGLPVEGGPIGVMLSEHDEGRGYIKQMAEAASDYHRQVESAGARWGQAALLYAGLLRQHIMKENNVLFMMAERMLSPEEQARLAEEFDRIEMERMGKGTHQRLHQKMDRLVAEFALG